MKKLIFVTMTMAWIVSCQNMKKETAAPVIRQETLTGPVILAADPSLSSVELVYRTETPAETKVLFTMAGDIDWLRSDYDKNLFHRMRFDALEEGATYQFQVPQLNAEARIRTMPYGDSYSFQFMIASDQAVMPDADAPHFVLLVSDKPRLTEKELTETYARNRRTLANTIIIPAFRLELNGQEYPLHRDAFSCTRYKNLSIITVTEAIPNTDVLASFISTAPDDENYIILTGAGNSVASDIIRKYAHVTRRIFSTGDQALTSEKFTVLKGPQLVTVEKKSRVAWGN